MNTRKYLSVLFFASLLLSSLAAPSAAHASGTIRYVRPSPSGIGNCSSWANACGLQPAIGLAFSGDQLWVRYGIYKPGSLQTDTFALKDGVKIYGGFFGNETLLGQRNPATHVTILSGDIDNNDTNLDGNNIDETTYDIQGSNAYHVVSSTGISSSAILDGFTITAGSARSTGAYSSGGGMYNSGSSPILTNVTFIGNNGQNGGGMGNNYSSSPTLTNVNFTSNSGAAGGGMFNGHSSPKLTNVNFTGNTGSAGGGMYNIASSPTLTNVTLSGNSATFYGGGIYNFTSSNPTLTNVTLIGNSAPSGGGMYNSTSSPTLTNVTLNSNSAANGGGMYNDASSDPALTNLTIYDNKASAFGGGMYNNSSNPTLTNVTFDGNSAPGGGGMVTITSTPIVHDSIFWNDGSELYNIFATPTVVDSIVSGGYASGTHVINADPLLGPLANNGGYTKTMALGSGSPAVDTGGQNSTCAATDQRGVTRPQGPACDMGAFEVKPPTFTSTLTSWNYGLVKVGTRPGGKTFSVKNTGDVNLVIGTVTLAGLNMAQFHLTANNCSNTILPPNGTCTFTATFKPTTAGDKTAYINIPDNAPGNPHQIQLSGKGGTEQSLNGGFNTYAGSAKIPTNWVATHFAATDGKNTTFKDAPYSVKIANTSAITKTLTQTRSVTGGVGSSFLLSLWRKGQGIPTTAGVVQAQVLLYSGSTLRQTKTIPFANGTYGFTQKSLTFTATHAYNKIVIKLIYSKGSGAVWFDALSLLRSP